MWEIKDIWVKVCQYQGETIKLKKAFKVRMPMQSSCEEAVKLECCSLR